MKLPQVLLLNVATVAIALAAYDFARTESSPSQGHASVSRSNATDTVDLERRLSALEAARRSAPPGVGAEPDVSDGLDAPEAAARGNAVSDDSATSDTTPIKRAGLRSEPTEEEVRRFRQLREAARRQDSMKRNWAKVSGALKKLSVNLTRKQRERVHYAYAAFEPRIRQIWDEAKSQARKTASAGGEINREVIVTTTTVVIQQELAKTLTDIVPHQADAEAIATALVPPPGTGKR